MEDSSSISIPNNKDFVILINFFGNLIGLAKSNAEVPHSFIRVTVLGPVQAVQLVGRDASTVECLPLSQRRRGIINMLGVRREPVT